MQDSSIKKFDKVIVEKIYPEIIKNLDELSIELKIKGDASLEESIEFIGSAENARGLQFYAYGKGTYTEDELLAPWFIRGSMSLSEKKFLIEFTLALYFPNNLSKINISTLLEETCNETGRMSVQRGNFGEIVFYLLKKDFYIAGERNYVHENEFLETLEWYFLGLGNVVEIMERYEDSLLKKDFLKVIEAIKELELQGGELIFEKAGSFGNSFIDD